MNGSATNWSSLRATARPDITVEHQVEAMGSTVFEIGLYNPNVRDGESVMIPRIWDAETITKAVPWLRFQNREGRNIYIRPRGEHDLSMIDDLTADALSTMKAAGFDPAVVVETSPGNYQAWLKHSAQLSRETSTAAARKLAEEFGGDRGAADWRHFGCLSGFTNRKPKYLDSVTGMYPYVRLIEATGRVYPASDRFLADLKRDLERRQVEKEHLKRYLTRAANARDVKGVFKLGQRAAEN